MYRYVLWDWNGTLLDDLDLNLEVENCLLARRGLQKMGSKAFYLAHFGFPIIEFYERLGFDFQKEPYEAVADEYIEEYTRRLPQAGLFPDTIRTLETLRENGMRQVIISASQKELLQRQVSQFGIGGFFDAVLGSEDNLGKSKVDAALDWLKKEGISPKEAAFIGDTTHDFETAAALGCDCFFVCRGHNDKDRLLRTGCAVFDDFEALCERLIQT